MKALCLVLALTSSAALADDSLETARETRDGAVSVAKQALVKRLGELGLDGEKDRCATLGIIPHSAKSGDAVESYRKARMEADAKLIEAYKTAEKASRAAGDEGTENQLRRERAEFAAKENVFEKSFEIVKGAAPTKAVDTGACLKTVTTYLQSEVDTIAKLDTSAKKDLAHIEMIRSANSALQRQPLTLHFPIKDVKLTQDNQYLVITDPPTEAKSVVGGYTYMAGISTGLTRDVVASTKPGDLLVVSGKGAMNGVAEDAGIAALPTPDNSLMVITSHNSISKYIYGIYLQGYTISVEHK